MAYTTPRKIYDRTSLTSDDIDEVTLEEYIIDATAEINRNINSKVVREKIEYIDEFRSNKIDGSNTTFYVKKSPTKAYFGDMNNSGTVTTSDIIVELLENETETLATVSSIDYDDMSFTLSSAPSASIKAIYVTYVYTYWDVVTPDKLIEMCTRYLTSAYAYAKVEYALGDNVKVGNLSISGISKNGGENKFLKRYNDLLNKLLSYDSSKNLPVTHEIIKRISIYNT